MLTDIQFQREVDKIDKLLFKFALKLTRDYQDAQDLWQDTCLRAYRYKDKFREGTNFKAWISTILRNLFITQWKKKKRRGVVSEPVEEYLYAIENTQSVPNAGERHMRMDNIMQRLNRLGKIYKLPFYMHYQGYEYKEIAGYFGIPVGTVKSRIHTARKKLKKDLRKAEIV